MALPVIVSRTQVQSVDLEVVRAARVTNGATGLYTVPTAKVAIMTDLTGLQDALGTDATAAIGFIRSSSFLPLSTFITATVPNNYVQWSGRMLLQAADIVTFEGDSGATNHTWDLTASIREYNA